MADQQGSHGTSGGSGDRNALDILESQIRADKELQDFLRLFLNRQSLDDQAQSLERILKVGLPVISQSPALDTEHTPVPEANLERRTPPIALTKAFADEGVPHGETAGAPFEEAQLFVPARFIDRKRELDWLKARLTQGATASVAAIRGMGGIGKTSLAGKASRELRAEGAFPDGIVVVLCQNQTKPDEVLRSIFARFNPRREDPHSDVVLNSDLAEDIQQQLRGKRALVVLDNVEPDLDVSRVANPLREAGAAVLITSRQALPSAVIPAGGSIELNLLDSDQALDVLVDAYRGNREIQLTDAQLEAARKIVEQLDHHTLALRLAGSYAANAGRDLVTLAPTLLDPARALTLSDAETPEVIVALFRQSTGALPAPAQQLFFALTAFGANEFGRNAALALAHYLAIEDPDATVDVLALRALLDTSVLTELPQGSDRERLRLHPLVRAFAERESPRPSESRHRGALRAVAAYYARYVHDILPSALARDQAAINDAIKADQTNINDAIERAYALGEWRLVLDLCIPMVDFWRDRWLTRDSRKLLPLGKEAATALTSQDDTPQHQRMLADLRLAHARALRRTEELVEAKKAFETDLEYRQATGDPEGEANVRQLLGEVYRILGDLDAAERQYQQSLQIWRALPDRRRYEGAVLGYLGRIAYARANYELADDYFAKSLRIAEDQLDQRGRGRVLNSLGQVALARGDMETAEKRFAQAISILEQIKDKPGISDVLTGMGRLAIDRSHLERADALFRDSLVIDREIMDLQGEAVDLSLLAQVALERGELSEAKRQFDTNVLKRRHVHDRRGEGVDLSFLGRIALERGSPSDLAEARAHYEQALAIAKEVGNKRGEGASLNQLGVVALRTGDAIGAERYLNQSMQRAHEIESGPDIARATLSQGEFAIRIERDVKKGRRLIKQAIQMYEQMQRPLDLQHAQALAQELEITA